MRRCHFETFKKILVQTVPCRAAALDLRNRRATVLALRQMQHENALSLRRDKGGNEIYVRVTQTGQPMDLHRFWDGVITSSSNLTRLRNEATALRSRQEFQRSQLTELASTGFESWAKESYEIATKIAYSSGGRIGIPRGGNMDCASFHISIRS
jgi:S1/P1 Nuclease